MGTDLHDTDSCLSVSMQDGVKNRCRTSPPWQQAGVNVEYPAVSGHIVFTIHQLQTLFSMSSTHEILKVTEAKLRR